MCVGSCKKKALYISKNVLSDMAGGLDKSERFRNMVELHFGLIL